MKVSNQLNTLIQQMYMDAEYRERTSAQMRETIINLEETVGKFQQKGDSRSRRGLNYDEGPYIHQLEESVNRFERLLSEKDHEKHNLLTEISNLSKENYQIRL